MPPWSLSLAQDLRTQGMWWVKLSSLAGITVLNICLGSLFSQLLHWLELEKLMG